MYLFAELKNYLRKCLYIKLLPRDVCKGLFVVCGNEGCSLEEQEEALFCKFLSSTCLCSWRNLNYDAIMGVIIQELGGGHCCQERYFSKY